MWDEICEIIEDERQRTIKISINNNICGGEPRLYNTRITISNMLAYLQDGNTIEDFSKDCNVSLSKCQDALLWLRNLLNDGNLNE